jgi:hypothetical protein
MMQAGIGLVALMPLLGCAPPAAPPVTPIAPQRLAATNPTVRVAAPPWPAVTNCRALAGAVLARPEAERVRLDPAASPLALEVSDAAGGATSNAVVRDVPLPPDDGARRCLLVVEVGPSARAAARRTLGHERAQSTYRAGGAGRPNPDYRRLQAELRAVQRAEAPTFVPTGDAGLDLIGLVAGGVLGGIANVVDAGRADALRERLAATPQRLDETIWEPYSFEVTTVEATRKGPFRAQLFDRSTGEVWAVEDTLVARRNFRVAEGRRARDRGLLEGGGDGLVDPTDVTAWEQAGVQPGLAFLLAALPEQSWARGRTAAFTWSAGPRGNVVAETGPNGESRYRLRGGMGPPALTEAP